ncbi:zinc finger protein 493-like isoform X2 [Cydia fagiglandana]|uniref:zinc finger protein 493-like isoform X2 n=1 Tax=Cydia fagiglandana TaxID=1458189 RepID=UPI002FEDEF05
MDLCRTCLKTPANKAMLDLERGINVDNKNYFEIMVFCLDIEVTQDSKITTNLCNTCYRKIISFYKFKVLSLKNDAYLKSLNPVISDEAQKLSVYVDENGIKHENPLEADEYGSCIFEEDRAEIDVKNEIKFGNEDIKNEEQLEDIKIEAQDDTLEDIESDKEPLSVVKKIKIEKSKQKISKKRGRPPKSKPEYQMCEECGKPVRNLKQHSVLHKPKDERKMYPCKVPGCPKLLFTVRGRKYHYKTTHLGLKFKCEICGKEVTNLSSHRLLVHNQTALRYGCASCGRRFLSRTALATHMTSHTQDHAFECDVCQKKFRSKPFVSRHIRQVHQKERKFQCEFCSKGFFRKSALNEHLRTHTEERPYKCEDCGKAFTWSSTLKSHRLIHSDEKRFHCKLCDKSFVKPGYLSAHMVSHTKEKRYPCAFCGVRFGRSDHRNRHQLTAHKKQRTPNLTSTT